MPDHPDDAAQRSAALHRVSAALGQPLAAFFGEPHAEVQEFTALTQLWEAITDPQARRRILSLARQEAARCGYGKTL